LTQTTTLRFLRVDDVMCLIHDERDPAPEDWRVYVAALATALAEHGVRKLLVVSAGGGPNAAQRKLLVDAIVPALGGDIRALKTAVCTSSPLARGITVALGWLSSASLTGFGYDERRQALDFLAVAVSRQRVVLLAVAGEIDALAAQRGPR